MEEKEMETVDVTKSFLDAVESLTLGELLHDPSFGLFEAMSAIEMMDPKMDAGMICNKGKRVIMNFEQAVEADKLKLEDITYEELLGITDTTISCLVTWLEGHSLAQTVFTNLYLHKPTAIVNKYLKAISVATLKQVDVIEECVSKAAVFEEEDFQPSVYGYNLATMFSDSKASSMLRECEDELQKVEKKLKTQQNHHNNQKVQMNGDANVTTPSTNSTTETEEGAAAATSSSSASIAPSHNNNVNNSANDLELVNALIARLKFMRNFHTLLLHIWKRDNLNDCPKLISICQESLQAMQKSSSLGIQRDSETFMIGFELYVNQRLLPPTFPRSTRIKSVQEAFSYMESFLQRAKTILKITTIQNFHGILDFFNTFSESQPCVLSRSLLQLLYGPLRFKKPGIDDMIESMKESVKSFIAPPVLINKTVCSGNREISECVEMFFERCANSFTSLLITCGHNRARQRDRFAHMLEEFANLQFETERIDAYIHSLCQSQMEGSIRQHGNCFSNWILYHISKLMIRYVLTGFELELYSVHEFAYIYWYLYEFLYGWLLSALSRAETYIAEGDPVNGEKSGGGGGKKGGKGKGNKGNKSKSKAYTKEILLIQAEQHLAGGYFNVMTGLMNDKRIPLPHKEFDNESVRYRHRFAAFAPIHNPSPVHYLQYKSIADLSALQPSVNLYVAAARSFHQARQYLEVIPGSEKEVAELLKIAKTNFVVVKLLASGHTKESVHPPEFDFSSDSHFPIIKVK